ncbi:MAG: universal stress protein [Deltaproteobacteria bacterium]|nr:universal stress protein [Deltaproteobacteria bacterium]
MRILQVNNILVPVEIHENAVPVVTWAALLARTLASRLTLLHVNESLEPLKARPAFQGGGVPGTTTTVEEWRSVYAQDARLELARLVEQCCTGLPVETVVLEGRAHRTILEYVEQTPHELIVMGTHGKPWYQRLLLGSTAEAVLRAASLPVLIVHNTAATQNPPRLKSLLLPTDFSAASTRGEEWALGLAEHGVEEVALVHAVENPLLDVYKPDTAEIDLRKLMEESRQHPPRSAQPFWDHAHRVAHAKLSLLQQQFLGAHVQVELLVGEGPAAEDILKVAEAKHVDLIVMATHGRTGVRRLLLGSVTEKVVRAASCPVLAVPSSE